MHEQPSCNHCFCRSKTVADDAMATIKRRVFYCCWCGEERGEDSPATTHTTPQAAAIVSGANLPRGVYGIAPYGTGIIDSAGSAFDAVAAALARMRDRPRGGAQLLYRNADGWRFVGIIHADGRFTDERRPSDA
jgi:hypothetical protein